MIFIVVVFIIIIIIIDPHHGCVFLSYNGNPYCDLHCNYDHHHGSGLFFSIGTFDVVFIIIGDHHRGHAFVFFVGDIDHGHALLFYW